MIEDRMRAEFEVWMGDFDFRPELEGELFIDEKRIDSETCGEFYYFDHSIQRCWVAWQASRAALEIELPETISVHNMDDSGFVSPAAEMYDDAIQDCRAAIEAAGVRVKQ